MRSFQKVQTSDSLPGEQLLEVVRRNGWGCGDRQDIRSEIRKSSAETPALESDSLVWPSRIPTRSNPRLLNQTASSAATPARKS
jgi:hypothetical protein